MSVSGKSIGLLLLVIMPSMLLAALGFADIESTICRSEEWGNRFREIAKGTVDILAVCPKKGAFFIEIIGSDEDVFLFY